MPPLKVSLVESNSILIFTLREIFSKGGRRKDDEAIKSYKKLFLLLSCFVSFLFFEKMLNFIWNSTAQVFCQTIHFIAILSVPFCLNKRHRLLCFDFLATQKNVERKKERKKALWHYNFWVWAYLQKS